MFSSENEIPVIKPVSEAADKLNINVENLLERLNHRRESIEEDEDDEESRIRRNHKSLSTMMTEVLEESCKNANLLNSQYLLKQLVEKEHLNCLIVNLLPGNEGYSLKYPNIVNAETIVLSYDEKDFLDYLDCQQIPPFILDILDEAPINLYYDNRIIIEMRDYRRNTIPTEYETTYTILRPTQETLIADVNIIANRISPDYALPRDYLINLEKNLLDQSEEALCLDPSPAVAVAQSIVEQNHLNSEGLVKHARKWNQASIARRRKYLSRCSGPSFSKLYDFLTSKSANIPQRRRLMSADTFKELPVTLSTPPNLEVMKYVKKSYERLKDLSPQVVEEWIYEREDSPLTCNVWNKIIVSRRADMFLCQIFDYNGNSECPLKSRKIEFKSRDDLDNYIQQFEKLFTESYSKAARITHSIAGQLPKINRIEGKINDLILTKTQPPVQQLSTGKHTFVAGNSQSLALQQQKQTAVTIASATTQLPHQRLKQMGIFAHVSRSPTPMPQVTLTTSRKLQSNINLLNSTLPSYTQATGVPVINGRIPIVSSTIAQTVTVSATQLNSFPNPQGRQNNQISPASINQTSFQLSPKDQFLNSPRPIVQWNLIKPMHKGVATTTGLSLLQLVSRQQLTANMDTNCTVVNSTPGTSQQLYITAVQPKPS